MIKLRGLEPSGRLVALDGALDTKLVGLPTIFAERTGSQGESESVDPDPGRIRVRRPDGAIDDTIQDYIRVAKNSLPRLAVDGSGRVWLAFRTIHPILDSPIGAVWTE